VISFCAAAMNINNTPSDRVHFAMHSGNRVGYQIYDWIVQGSPIIILFTEYFVFLSWDKGWVCVQASVKFG